MHIGHNVCVERGPLQNATEKHNVQISISTNRGQGWLFRQHSTYVQCKVTSQKCVYIYSILGYHKITVSLKQPTSGFLHTIESWMHAADEEGSSIDSTASATQVYRKSSRVRYQCCMKRKQFRFNARTEWRPADAESTARESPIRTSSSHQHVRIVEVRFYRKTVKCRSTPVRYTSLTVLLLACFGSCEFMRSASGANSTSVLHRAGASGLCTHARMYRAPKRIDFSSTRALYTDKTTETRLLFIKTELVLSRCYSYLCIYIYIYLYMFRVKYSLVRVTLAFTDRCSRDYTIANCGYLSRLYNDTTSTSIKI